LRLVLDADVLVAGFAIAIAAGASRRLLPAALDGEVRLLLSTSLIRMSCGDAPRVGADLVLSREDRPDRRIGAGGTVGN